MMTIKTLRAECPEWAWSAERDGFSYRYVGRRDKKRVVVRSEAVLIGEDDFASRWVVDDGTCTVSYASWWLNNQCKGML